MSTRKQFGPKGWTPEQLGSLAGKTYVITGANAGAGFEATRVFLSKAAKVVMMNRNADKSTAAIATLKQEFGNDADVTFVRMDLAVLGSVREAAEEELESEKLYGPTKRTEMVGPVGECPLDNCALDQEQATKLWTLSEQKTSLSWSP